MRPSPRSTVAASDTARAELQAPPPGLSLPAPSTRVRAKQRKIGVYPAHDELIVEAMAQHGCTDVSEMYRKVITAGVKSLGLLPVYNPPTNGKPS
jgi:hypothetical protein